MQSGRITGRKLQRLLGDITVLTVNGDDVRFKSINKEDYYYVNDTLTVNDFPVTSGTREVEYDVTTFDHEPTTQEVVNWQNQPGFRPPDRAEIETYLDAVPDAPADMVASPIVCLFAGTVSGDDVAYVYADDNGRNFNRGGLVSWWRRGCRFVRVRITK